MSWEICSWSVSVKDIYRSQIVFLESALDYYMHCLGIYAMVQMYNNHWDKTRGYSDLKVPIDKVMDACYASRKYRVD